VQTKNRFVSECANKNLSIVLFHTSPSTTSKLDWNSINR